MKVKKVWLIALIILFSFYTNSFAYEENPDEWDYVWLDEAIEESKKEEEPKILSRYAAVYERNSKVLLWGKEENTKVPMASTTKIMTAIVMLETLGEENLKEEVIVSKEAANTGGSRLGIHTGDKISYNDLLYGLMLCSGNDAAMQIAISIAGNVEDFAELMNNKAKEMGFEHTHFVTPHGLDEDEHYTTAFELAKITDYALNIPKIKEVVGTKNYTVLINGYPKALSNTNELLGYLEGVYCVKTGYTSRALRCLVTSCKRGDLDVITVVLGADTKKIRTKDSVKLIEYAFKSYKLMNIEERIQEEFDNWIKINKNRIYVYKSKTNDIDFCLEPAKYKVYPIKTNDNIMIFSDVQTFFEAPINANTKVGTIYVKKEDKTIDEIKVKLKNNIKRKKPLDYLKQVLRHVKIAI